ncbi:MAG TPA: hypothetical protein VFL98_02600 [Candidatus Paceibacterota bacterium]|nr:hypothetical protein [Candidatus Paceibacterota bacterium]
MRKNPIAPAIILVASLLLFVTSLYAVPTAAFADTCGTPAVGDFTPYVYSGHLDSFDYYISDQSGTQYLPLSVTINGTPVDLQYISIWRNVGPDRIKVHVDVPASITMLRGTDITIATLQVTQGPPPICLSNATFHVNLPSAPATPAATIGQGSTSGGSTSSHAAGSSSAPQNSSSSTSVKPATSTVIGATSTATTSPATTTPATGAACRIIPLGWLLLLALLDIIISAALLLFMSFIAPSNARLIAAVLVPPAVFIGFWYFVDSCHTDVWFPIFSVILALLVLTGSGTPDTFEPMRRRISSIFGKKNATLRLMDLTHAIGRK